LAIARLSPIAEPPSLRHCGRSKIKWVVYAKEPLAGPEPVLGYLSRYTHRVAISNRCLVAADHEGVAFRWKVFGSMAPIAGR
jgi:hypothetical protein